MAKGELLSKSVRDVPLWPRSREFALIVHWDHAAVPEPTTLTLSGLTALTGLAYRSFGCRRARAAA
jgi:hypothetical protein